MTQIMITEVLQHVLFPVYNNAGVYTQAVDDFPTHVAILNSIPTATGLHVGLVSAPGDTVNILEKSKSPLTITFAAAVSKSYVGKIAISDINVDVEATCLRNEIKREANYKEAANNLILSQYKKEVV